MRFAVLALRRWRERTLAQRRSQDSRATGRVREVVPEGFSAITDFATDDVFIVGYPKSGNTWVQTLLSAAVFGLDLDRAPESLVQDLVPDVHSRKFYRRYSSPVFFKSHALPTVRYKRVVYLVRDGRDTMVSYWHHLQAVRKTNIDFLELVRRGEGLLPCKWHEHVQRWLTNPFGAQMMVVKYEEFQQDSVKQLKRIGDFAGLQWEPGVLEAAVTKASFAAMQEREQRFGWSNCRWPKDKAFIRRGAVGSYIDEMPPDVQMAFLHQAAVALRQLGYEAAL